jgi:hypothetical protein
VLFVNQKCEYLDLVVFEGSVLEHQKPKSELMFDFSFSGSYPKKTTKTSFLRSSLIPEWMEMGIVAEVGFLRGGNPKRSCSLEIKK